MDRRPALQYQRRSLADRAGKKFSIALSIAIAVAHVCFGYAQLSGVPQDCGADNMTCPQFVDRDVFPFPPGGLMKGIVRAHVDFRAAGLLDLALNELTEAVCYSKGHYMECPDGDDTFVPMGALNQTVETLCTALQCGGIEIDDIVLHVSYLYSVEKLWTQPGWIINTPPTGVYPGRGAAVTLVVWSFIWPHVKLMLMQLAYYYPFRIGKRRNINYVVSFFGKWSLLDVLVMAAVIGLFNIFVDMSFPEIWADLSHDFLGACDALCANFTAAAAPAAGPAALAYPHANAHLPRGLGRVNCSAACRDIFDLMEDDVLSKQELPSSEVDAGIRVFGLEAMYSFCIAVIISLTASVFMEFKDDELRQELVEEAESISEQSLRRKLEAEAGASRAPWQAYNPRDDERLTMMSDTVMSDELPEASGHAPGRAAKRPQGATSSASGALGAALLDDRGDGGDAELMERQAEAQPPAEPPAPAAAMFRASSPPPAIPSGGGINGGGINGGASSTRVQLQRRPAGGAGRGGRSAARTHAIHVVMVVLQLLATIGTISAPMFERVVEGSMAMALAQRGIDFTAYISMIECARLAARGGGFNLLMAGCFWLFNCVSPVLRALTLLALLTLPLTLQRARALFKLSRVLIAFYALDVMLVCTPLINMSFGPMSQVLLDAQTFPLCASLNAEYHTEFCFRIDVNPKTGYWFNVVTIALMAYSGFDGSATHKYIHRKLYPTDLNPPPTFGCRD